jgi:RNA recognition motif-containing protein
MNIYVGNLSYSVTEEDLNAMFAEFGDVTSAKLIMDRDTGRSKGFAFVEMSGEDAGQKAIDELNGRDVGGRSLTVNKARPREERPRGGGGGGRGGYGGGGGGGNRY